MPREDSTLIRVYVYEAKVLFLENANSPIGVPIGSIIQTDTCNWSFFPGRARGLDLFEMQEVCLKLAVLNETSKARHDDTAA